MHALLCVHVTCNISTTVRYERQREGCEGGTGIDCWKGNQRPCAGEIRKNKKTLLLLCCVLSTAMVLSSSHQDRLCSPKGW